jgi:hypothetical protein
MSLYDDLVWFGWIALGCLILYDGGKTHEITNQWLAFLMCMGVATVISYVNTKTRRKEP